MPHAPLVPSPCNQICRLDANGTCVGCARTMHEISRWPWMSPEEKRTVLARIAATRKATPPPYASSPSLRP